MEQQVRHKYADSREPQELKDRLLATGWAIQQLYTADFFFHTHDFKRVGVERKEINDFLSSMGDRLARQLENSLEHYDIVILLLEGSWKTVNPTGQLITARGVQYYTWDMVWNFIERWQQKNVHVQLTVNMGHTIHRLNELFAFYMKPYSLSAKSRDFHDDRILSLPSGTRGKVGQLVLDTLGSIQAVANASVDDLLKVEGVGNRKAQSIYDHMRKVNGTKESTL